MRKAAFEKYGLIIPAVSKSLLHHFYNDLTGDSSAVTNLTEAEINERVKMFFDLEEPDVIYDLREMCAGRSSKFHVFWKKAKVAFTPQRK